MNRRKFLAASVAAVAIAPTLRTAALEDISIDTLISDVCSLLPDQPDREGFTFPVTTGTVGPLQRSVWPENPDMYWDPVGEDYWSIFEFSHRWMMLGASQMDATLWTMYAENYLRDVTRQKLESNGWQIVDSGLHLLRFAGDELERENLASSLNMLGTQVQNGEWNWIALPDAETVVMGGDGDRVRMIADRVVNRTPGSSIEDRVHTIRSIVRNDSYLISFLPPERLPMEGVDISFISRSWTGDTPIIHSIGMQLETEQVTERMVETVQSRMESETSGQTDAVYADFLKLQNVWRYEECVRFDFIASTDKWDVFEALHAGDLGMLPTD